MNICHNVSNRIFSSSSFPQVMTLMTGFEIVLFVFFFSLLCNSWTQCESKFRIFLMEISHDTFRRLVLVCNYKLHLLLIVQEKEAGQTHFLV